MCTFASGVGDEGLSDVENVFGQSVDQRRSFLHL